MYFLVKLLIIATVYAEFTSSNFVIRSEGSHWSYDGDDGPDFWQGVCGHGVAQSPINIGFEKEPLFGAPLKFIGGFSEDVSWKSTWNGHAFVAQMESTEISTTLHGGNLGSTYVFQSLHLHWGSEHTIHGIRFDGEMHLVHYNKKYTYQNALLQPDGLAVVGIFLQGSNVDENEDFSEFIEAMSFESDDESKSIGKFKFASFLHKPMEPWVRYDGSLTTPPCTENVQWSVLLEPILIKKDLIRYSPKHNTTYRPTQNLNNRTVFIQRVINGSAGLNYNLKLIINLFLCTITMSIVAR